MSDLPSFVSVCPRCRRSTGSPFAVAGVCLRCAGERVLTSEVDHAFFGLGNDPPPPRIGVASPDRIGPYQIIDELGRGGMGCIYAARQIGLGRIVALKVLATRGDLAGLDLRFLREAQTVARLRHPHIVSVYDSGRTEGYVYFSMEYLPDGDLGRRLRERPYSPHGAAELMEKVAAATAAAHAEGVLHRDIKPSNILLDGDDPKLADFGLAAQLEAGGDLTAISGVLGTPHYLAPEALKGGSAALTIASDIYALGAVLYEALTGRPPFGTVSPAELTNLLAVAEPPSPRLLSPGVPVDLETICLKCLEREPGRRYATAGAVATDLHRFRLGQTVLARPPSRWDRCRKFALRHSAAVIAASSAMLVLAAGTVVSTAWAIRARRAERRASAEAATATALADFLEHDLLAQADPAAQPDRNITLHAVLDRAATKIDQHFPGQPLVAADVHAVAGEVYDSLGDYDAARPHFERAIALRRHQLGPDHPDTLTAMQELAEVLYDTGKLSDAKALGELTRDLRRRVLGSNDPGTIESANLVAMALRDLGRMPQADRAATETLDAAKRALPANHEHLVTAFRTLGSIRLAQYRLGEAETLMKEAADRQLAAAGAENLATLTTWNDLATVYRQEGKSDRAVELYERVLSARQRLLGPNHPHTISSMNNLASAYRAQNLFAKSEPLQVAAVEAGTRTLGREHPRVVIMLNNLAETYRHENKLDEALATATETLALSRRVYGQTHATTVNVLGGLADILMARGEAVKAEPLLREAIEASPKVPLPPWKTDALQSQLGLALAQRGDYAAAEPLVRQSYERLRTAEPSIPESYRKIVGQASDRVVEFLTLAGRPDAAAAWAKDHAKERKSGNP